MPNIPVSITNRQKVGARVEAKDADGFVDPTTPLAVGADNTNIVEVSVDPLDARRVVMSSKQPGATRVVVNTSPSVPVQQVYDVTVTSAPSMGSVAHVSLEEPVLKSS
jgi:hypothetical protein